MESDSQWRICLSALQMVGSQTRLDAGYVKERSSRNDMVERFPTKISHQQYGGD